MPARRWTDQQLRDAVACCRTMSDVCRALGLVPAGANYETIWKRIEHLGIEGEHLVAARSPAPAIDTTVFLPGRLTAAVEASTSVAGVCRSLGLDPVRQTRRVRNAIARVGIDTSHFKGQGWSKGLRFPSRGRPLAEMLCEGVLCQSSDLRLRLLSEASRNVGARCAALRSGSVGRFRSSWSTATAIALTTASRTSGCSVPTAMR